MTGDEAVKALREWCAEGDGARSGVRDDLRRAEERNRAAGCGGYADVVAKGGALLSAAPALLARIEAGEGLLREAREWLASMSMQQGRPSKVLLKDIDAIAVFLAAKEADRG